MIDFMLIVLNGEPWIEPWLKTYEPHANNIFIIEGTDTERFRGIPQDLRKLCHTEDGHSIDNTRDIIRSYPSDKITLIDKSPKGNGFWKSKNQMIKQINYRVQSQWVWQADCDEFYHQSDIKRIKNQLKADKKTMVWQFGVNNFWKSASYILRGGWVSEYRRIFRWVPGKTEFKEHRPPTTTMDGPPKTLPHRLYHYNYVLEHDARYKPAYHKGMYGGNWFENKWVAWSPKTREQIEKRGIGPARNFGRTGTVQIQNVKHPEFVAPIIQNLINEGKIYA